MPISSNDNMAVSRLSNTPLAIGLDEDLAFDKITMFSPNPIIRFASNEKATLP